MKYLKRSQPYLIWLVVLSLVLFDVAALMNLSNRVVGKTPEGFHRADAAEIMELLCRSNPGLRCPDPYATPLYKDKLRGELEATE